MEISKELCSPDTCSYECINACKKIHGDSAPLGIDSAGMPRVDDSTCTSCLSCLRACPFDAITVEYRPAKKRDHDDSRLLDTDEVYELREPLESFPESRMIFARVRSDPGFAHYGKDEWYGSEAMIAKDLPGYSKFESELAKAAWDLYDNRQKVTGPAIPEIVSPQEDLSLDESQDLTRMIKDAAKFFGAGLVGIAGLDHRWVYSADRHDKPYNIPEKVNRAIVMAIEMDYDGISTSPSFTSSATTARAYSEMAFLEIELSAFIRRLGYTAIPCGNDIALSVPLAIDAGLGQYGRHGLLITKEYGPRVRLAKVLTDMPLEPDQPDEDFCKSVIRFCETCKKCAKTCPSQSIPFDEGRTWAGKTVSNRAGIKKWYVNPETCYGFWLENGSECSNCIRSCPYNKEDGIFHRTVLWLVQNMPILNRLIVFFDDLVGYGKQENTEKFWHKIN